MEECSCNILSNKTFDIGDIVQYKNNPQVKYIVTSLGSMSGKPTWQGLSSEGHSNGGTIYGSWDFDDFEVIDHYPIKEMYEYIKRSVKNNGTKE